MTCLKSVESMDKEQLFGMVKRLYATNYRENLGRILRYRLSQLDHSAAVTPKSNIYYKLSSVVYRELIGTDCPLLSKDDLIVEKCANLLFDDFADFWCEYEIYNIQIKYKREAAIPSINITYDENQYEGIIIDDISHYEGEFYTMYAAFKMNLSDAVLLSNLYAFVKFKHWYEMLFLLDISASGQHFIMTIPFKNNSSSMIVSTARINGGSNINNWLYFSSFFQSDLWDITVNHTIEQDLNRKINLLPEAKFNYSNVRTFENCLLSSIADRNIICEVIRLTASGNSYNQLFILYLAQKKITHLLHINHMELAFIVTEQAMEVAFYNSLGGNIFQNIGTADILETGELTYKGISFISELEHQFNRLNFAQYKRKCISCLKGKALTRNHIINE